MYAQLNPAARGQAAALGLLLLTAAAAPGGPVAVWQTFPWLKEDPTADPARRAMMPEGEALAQMADREYEAVCLCVENRSERMLRYRIDASAIEAAVPGEADGGLRVEVRSSWVTPIRHADANGAALKTLGVEPRAGPGDVGDPLLLVTPDRFLYCPPGENRSVWLILHANGAKPGVYRAPVRLISAPEGELLAEVAGTVQVWPFALPEQLGIACYHWDYGCHPTALRNMREHKVNTFMIDDFPREFQVHADGTVSGKLALDRIAIKKEAVPWARFVGSYGGFQDFYDWSQKQGIEYLSPRFKELFAKGLRYMVAQYRQAGLAYDDFVLQHIDEAHGEKAARVTEMGKLAREIDPQIRWMLTVMSDLNEIRAMAPYTDLIGKRGEAYWSEEEQTWYRQYQAAGHEVWQFKQMGMARGEPAVHQWNRLRQWRTWLNRWTGSCTFVYSHCVYDPYRDPVPVRHWEAIREGNEDYQYFAMLRELGRRLGPAREAEAVAAVDSWVIGLIGPTAPGTAMLYAPEDPAVMLTPYRARAALAARIAALRNEAGLPSPDMDGNVRYRPPWIVERDPGPAPGKSILPDRSDGPAGAAQAWAPLPLRAGCRYLLQFRYQCHATLHNAVRLESVAVKKNRKDRLVPEHIAFTASLAPTAGREHFFRREITVERDMDYRLQTAPAGYQVALQPDGARAAPSLEVHGLDLRYLDTDPLLRAVRAAERRVQRLREQTAQFEDPNDPLLQAVNAAASELPRLRKAAEQAGHGPDAPAAAPVLRELRELRETLDSHPYATWIADAYELPLPSLPRSSRMHCGAPSLSPAGRAPRLGSPDPAAAKPLDAAPVCVANFRDEPLCFLVRAKGVSGGICLDRGAPGRKPALYRPAEFEEKRGWFEFVIPAGQTGCLWLEESGELELLSTDRRAPDLALKLEIEAGLGL